MRPSTILPLSSPSSARVSGNGGRGYAHASPQRVARMGTSPRNDIAPRPPPPSTSSSEYAPSRRLYDPSDSSRSGSILPVLLSPAQVQLTPLRTPSPNAFKRTVWTTPRGGPQEPSSASSAYGLQTPPRRHSRSYEDDEALLDEDAAYPYYDVTGDSTSYMLNPDQLGSAERADSPSSSSMLQSRQQGRRNDNPEQKQPKCDSDDTAQLAYMEQMYNTIQVLNAELERERQDRTRLQTTSSSIDDEITATLEYPSLGAGGGNLYAASNYCDDPGMHLLVDSTPSTASGARRSRPMPSSQQPKRPVPTPQSRSLSKDQVELCATLGKNAELRIRTKEMEESAEKTAVQLDQAQKQMKTVERRISNREEKLRILMKEKLHWQKELKDMRDQVVEEKMRQVELFRRLETAKREGAAQMEQLEHDLRDAHDDNQNLRIQVAEARAHVTFQTKKLDDVVRLARDEKEKLVSCIAETRYKFKEWKEGEAAALRSSREQAVNNVKTEYELKIARHQEEKQKLREKVKDLEVSLRLMQKDRTLSPLELSLRKATILGSKDNAGTNEAELIEAHSRIRELEALMEHSQEYQKRQDNIIKVSETTISRLVQEREVTALENLSAQPLAGGFMGSNPMSSYEHTGNNLFTSSVPSYSVASSPNVGVHRDAPKRQSYGSAKNSLSGDNSSSAASYGKPRAPGSNRIQPASSSPLLSSQYRSEPESVIVQPPAAASASSFSLMTSSPSKLNKASSPIEMTPYQAEDESKEENGGPQRQDMDTHVDSKARLEVTPPEPIREEQADTGITILLSGDGVVALQDSRGSPDDSMTTTTAAISEPAVGSLKEQLLANEVARLQKELAELKASAVNETKDSATALATSNVAENPDARPVEPVLTADGGISDEGDGARDGDAAVTLQAVVVGDSALDGDAITKETENDLGCEDGDKSFDGVSEGERQLTPSQDVASLECGDDDEKGSEVLAPRAAPAAAEFATEVTLIDEKELISVAETTDLPVSEGQEDSLAEVSATTTAEQIIDADGPGTVVTESAAQKKEVDIFGPATNDTEAKKPSNAVDESVPDDMVLEESTRIELLDVKADCNEGEVGEAAVMADECCDASCSSRESDESKLVDAKADCDELLEQCNISEEEHARDEIKSRLDDEKTRQLHDDDAGLQFQRDGDDPSPHCETIEVDEAKDCSISENDAIPDENLAKNNSSDTIEDGKDLATSPLNGVAEGEAPSAAAEKKSGSLQSAEARADVSVFALLDSEQEEEEVKSTEGSSADEKATEASTGAEKAIDEPALDTTVVQLGDTKDINEVLLEPEASPEGVVDIAGAPAVSLDDELPSLVPEIVTTAPDVSSVPETDCDVVCNLAAAPTEEEKDNTCLPLEHDGDDSSTLFFNDGELCNCDIQKEQEQPQSVEQPSKSERLSVVGFVASNIVAQVVRKGLHHSIVLHLEHRKYVAKTFVLTVVNSTLQSVATQLAGSQECTERPAEDAAVVPFLQSSPIENVEQADALGDDVRVCEHDSGQSSVAEQVDAAESESSFVSESTQAIPTQHDEACEQSDSLSGVHQSVPSANDETLLAIDDDADRVQVLSPLPAAADDGGKHSCDLLKQPPVPSQDKAVSSSVDIQYPLTDVEAQAPDQSQTEEGCGSREMLTQGEAVAAVITSTEAVDSTGAVGFADRHGDTADGVDEAGDAAAFWSVEVSRLAKNIVLAVQHEAVASVLSELVIATPDAAIELAPVTTEAEAFLVADVPQVPRQLLQDVAVESYSLETSPAENGEQASALGGDAQANKFDAGQPSVTEQPDAIKIESSLAVDSIQATLTQHDEDCEQSGSSRGIPESVPSANRKIPAASTPKDNDADQAQVLSPPAAVDEGMQSCEFLKQPSVSLRNKNVSTADIESHITNVQEQHPNQLQIKEDQDSRDELTRGEPIPEVALLTDLVNSAGEDGDTAAALCSLEVSRLAKNIVLAVQHEAVASVLSELVIATPDAAIELAPVTTEAEAFLVADVSLASQQPSLDVAVEPCPRETSPVEVDERADALGDDPEANEHDVVEGESTLGAGSTQATLAQHDEICKQSDSSSDVSESVPSTSEERPAVTDDDTEQAQVQSPVTVAADAREKQSSDCPDRPLISSHDRNVLTADNQQLLTHAKAQTPDHFQTKEDRDLRDDPTRAEAAVTASTEAAVATVSTGEQEDIADADGDGDAAALCSLKLSTLAKNFVLAVQHEAVVSVLSDLCRELHVDEPKESKVKIEDAAESDATAQVAPSAQSTSEPDASAEQQPTVNQICERQVNNEVTKADILLISPDANHPEQQAEGDTVVNSLTTLDPPVESSAVAVVAAVQLDAIAAVVTLSMEIESRSSPADRSDFSAVDFVAAAEAEAIAFVLAKAVDMESLSLPAEHPDFCELVTDILDTDFVATELALVAVEAEVCLVADVAQVSRQLSLDVTATALEAYSAARPPSDAVDANEDDGVDCDPVVCQDTPFYSIPSYTSVGLQNSPHHDICNDESAIYEVLEGAAGQLVTALMSRANTLSDVFREDVTTISAEKVATEDLQVQEESEAKTADETQLASQALRDESEAKTDRTPVGQEAESGTESNSVPEGQLPAADESSPLLEMSPDIDHQTVLVRVTAKISIDESSTDAEFASVNDAQVAETHENARPEVSARALEVASSSIPSEGNTEPDTEDLSVEAKASEIPPPPAPSSGLDDQIAPLAGSDGATGNLVDAGPGDGGKSIDIPAVDAVIAETASNADVLAALIAILDEVERSATTAGAFVAEESDRFRSRVTWSLPPEAEPERPAPTPSPKSRRTERRRTSRRLLDHSRYVSIELMRDPTLSAYDVHREQAQPFALLDNDIFSIDPNARHMQHDENDRAKFSESEIRAKRLNFEQDNHRKSIAFRSIPAFNYAPLFIRFQWSDFVIATPISVSSPVDPADKNAWSPVKKMRLIAKKGIKLACGSYVIISAFIRPLEDGNENLRIHIYDSEWVEEFQYDFFEDHLKAYMHEWSGRDDEARLFMTQLEFRREEGGIIIKLPDKVGQEDETETDKRPTTAPAMAMTLPDGKEHPHHHDQHTSPQSVHRSSRHSHSHRPSSTPHGPFQPIRSLPNLSDSSLRESTSHMSEDSRVGNDTAV